MKKVLLLIGLCPMFLNAQVTILEDNFDSYTAGDYAGVVSPWMNAWSLTPGGADDAFISSAQSSSPSNSVEIVGQSGPTDALIVFPEQYASGQYKFSMKYFVVTGQAGYFNCQESFDPGVGWKCDVFFANDGTGYISADGVEFGANFNYNQNEWFDVVIEADLTADLGELWIAGTLVHTFTWSTGVVGDGVYSRWGGLNFYAYGPSDQAANYFFDDILLEDMTALYASTENAELLSFSVMPNPSNGQFAITLNTNENYDLMINDISGKLVHSETAISSGHQLDLDLETGTYFVTIYNENEKVVEKMIIQ